MTEGSRKRTMDNVESKGDLDVFNWNITNFTQAFEETKVGGIMTSPVFVGKSIEQPNSFWHIEVHPKETADDDDDEEEKHLDVYLVFIEELNEHNPDIKVKLEFLLLDRNQQEVSRSVDETKHELGLENSSLGFKMVTNYELLKAKSKYLEDDTLRVRVNLWIQNVEKNETEKPASKMQKKLHLQKDLRQLLDSSQFSDVTILVDDVTFKAHKNILSCRSPVFSAMFQNEMSESLTNTVKIEDFSTKTVKAMLDFLYSENMEIVVDEDFVDLLKIAEKYQIMALKAACTETAILKMSTENVLDFLILGDVHNTPDLKSKAMDFINSNKAGPMFPSQGNQNGALEKFAKEYPMLLLEMFQNVRNKNIEEVTTFTTPNVRRNVNYQDSWNPSHSPSFY